MLSNPRTSFWFGIWTLTLGTCAVAAEPNWKETTTLDGKFYVNGMSISAGGKVLAAIKPTTARRFGALSFVKRDIAFYDTHTGKQISELKFKEDLNAAVMWPDAKHLTTITNRGEVSVWDTKTKKAKKSFRIAGTSRGLKLIDDGKTLITLKAARNLAMIYAYDVQTGRIRAKLRGRYRGDVTLLQGAALSPDRRLLACSVSSSLPGTAGVIETKIWNLKTGKATASLPNVGGELTFAPNQQMLAIASWGRGLTTWNVAAKKVQANIPAKAPLLSRYHQLTFSPDSETLITIERHTLVAKPKFQPLKAWNPQTLKSKKLRFPFDAPKEVRFSADWSRAATRHSNGEIKLWKNEPTSSSLRD